MNRKETTSPNTKKLVSYTLIGVAAAGIGFFAVLGTLVATTAQTIKEDQPKTVAITSTIPEPAGQRSSVTQPADEVVEVPVQAASEPVTAEPSDDTPAQTIEPSQDVSTPWSAPMSTAGIAEQDHATVLALAFTGFDWNLTACNCGGPASRLISPESRFTYLNQYVQRTYGSWSAAQAQAAQGRW